MADQDELGAKAAELALALHRISIMFEQLRSDNRRSKEAVLQRFDDLIAHFDRRFDTFEARSSVIRPSSRC